MQQRGIREQTPAPSWIALRSIQATAHAGFRTRPCRGCCLEPGDSSLSENAILTIQLTIANQRHSLLDHRRLYGRAGQCR